MDHIMMMTTQNIVFNVPVRRAVTSPAFRSHHPGLARASQDGPGFP